MLTKALLTGGILSVLAGSIVYFGTEGAIADERTDTVRIELDSTELAGGETSLVETTTTEKTVEAEDPPKRKWLDQYLKSDDRDEEKEEPEVTVEEKVEKQKDSSVDKSEMASEETKKVDADEASATNPGRNTREDIISMMNKAAKRPVKDQDMIDAARKDDTESNFMPTDRIDEARSFKRADPKVQGLPLKQNDYNRVLEEARKIEISDIRDQAMLEIIDNALDRGQISQAADVVSELSKPELRDTARSRIGVSLAQLGNTDAAFAIIEDIEIEELTAPIRLEIISALMATREERSKAKPRFSE